MSDGRWLENETWLVFDHPLAARKGATPVIDWEKMFGIGNYYNGYDSESNVTYLCVKKYAKMN
ncbi:MAG: hypothetical protein JW936_11845 [Sedimentisphaerales bacterium]|nr:hypothetical protein [Sedimentisphaerales bacterium]